MGWTRAAELWEILKRYKPSREPVNVASPASDLWGWGKTNRRDAQHEAFAWLGLVDHGLDVASVFRALATGPYRIMLQALFARSDDVLLDSLAAFAGLHDLAKASWTFQGMPNGPTPLPRRSAFGYIHHSDEACAFLCGTHMAALPGLAAALRPVADLADADDKALLRAVFSHHGLPRNGRDWEHQTDLPARLRPLSGQNGTRDPLVLVRDLVQALPTRTGLHPLAGLDLPQRHAALHGIMGLVSLADWIGSSAAWFPLTDQRPQGFDRWWAARHALAEIGWPLLGLGHASDADAVREVLALYSGGTARSLRPAQARVVEAVMSRPPQPGDVMVLEDETGGGKTLAAFLVHALLARRGLCTGLTFCLPTRASARQIHKGAAQVFGERVAPVLAVGGYETSVPLPGLSDKGVNERQPLGWAARRPHRFLAAPVAIGTVDQVLLGALTVRFAHLRQVAPACNLMVVDEVHASDPYMRGLLREVVQRRRASGGITLLMSATLGGDLRRDLLAVPRPAPARGGGVLRGTGRDAVREPAGLDALDAPYPALWLGPDEAVPLSDGRAVPKVVEVVPCGDWHSDAVGLVAARAVAAARLGARVLVIRNTVGLARATATAVAVLAPELMLHIGPHPVCHHARFAAEDRLQLDAALMTALDPDPGKRGGGVIAVTTQTSEQSLDIDVDLLITDLVPIDVLLQRIGRLHRNRLLEAAARRPQGFADARCIVLGPASPRAMLDYAASPGRGPNGWGTDRAYADTLALAATRALIADGDRWRIPDDNRRLVEAGTSKAARNELAVKFGGPGEEAAMRTTARAMFENDSRKQVSWSWHNQPDGAPLCQSGRFETRADSQAVTRLGLSDKRIEMTVPFRSPLGDWDIPALTVPGWLALLVGLEGDLTATAKGSADEVDLLVDGCDARFRYGPFGLTVQHGGRWL
jgi:CRISPR-associated endonuclease/helicase Cas3